MGWSTKKTMKFIDDYRENAFLWDTRLPDYENKELRRHTLVSLAKKYDCDVDHITNKIKSLRAGFRREDAKVKETGEKSTWFGYQALSFIRDITFNYYQFNMSTKTTLNFIDDYRKNACLWDTRVPDYENKDLKKLTLVSLAKKYDCEVDHTLNKIKSLRARFRREDIKVKETGEKSTWFAYRAMSFIREVERVKTYRWGKDTILWLVKAYRANPVLWDPKVPGYFNKPSRKAAYRKLAKKYNTNVHQIKKKIRYLRIAFKSEFNKIRQSSTYTTSRWYAYKPLSFLLKDESLELEQDVEKKHSDKNGDIDVMESQSSSSKFRDDVFVDTDETESDSDQSDDSEQSVDCYSSAPSFSENTDKISNKSTDKTDNKNPVQIVNGPEPTVKISAISAATQTETLPNDSVTQERWKDEDFKFLESLLSHIHKIPEHKKLCFRNVVQGVVQQFAYRDCCECKHEISLGTSQY